MSAEPKKKQALSAATLAVLAEYGYEPPYPPIISFCIDIIDRAAIFATTDERARCARAARQYGQSWIAKEIVKAIERGV
jgi:hypothetical protein